MKLLKLIAASMTLCLVFAGNAQAEDACVSWMDHDVTKLNSSETVDLCAETAGKPVLVVNTASYCGFTYQFTGLEALYQKYKDDGLVVVGFPSDDFNQEDDDASATAEVCYVNHGVTFLMSEVVDVKNDDAHPLFAHLGAEAGEPNWNFNKYVVSPDGEVVAHFNNTVEPDSAEMESAIESVLQ
jgi:glutathione peroxidase